MKTIYQAENITQAHIVAGLLESYGIETHVGGHYLQGAVGDIGAMNLARIWVADEDYTAALPIIAEYEQSQPVYEREDEPQPHTRCGFTKPVLFWGVILLFGIWLLF